MTQTDEELKKTIEGLSQSVVTMQAKVKTLRGEVTHSDKNSLAGSQNSDLVPSTGPTGKRRGTEDETDSEEEEEDPDIELGDAETERYQLSEAAGAFIEMTFKSKLDNATRKVCATKYGVPVSGG